MLNRAMVPPLVEVTLIPVAPVKLTLPASLIAGSRVPCVSGTYQPFDQLTLDGGVVPFSVETDSPPLVFNAASLRVML